MLNRNFSWARFTVYTFHFIDQSFEKQESEEDYRLSESVEEYDLLLISLN